MFEFFSGTSVVTSEFLRRGWSAFSFDISRSSNSMVICDARLLPIKKVRVDFIWLSPPCNEFTRFFLPWFKDSPAPSLELFKTSLEIVDYFHPKFWLIENTKGGNFYISKFHKPANVIVNPWYFWTNVPNISKFSQHIVSKNSRQIRNPITRGSINKRLLNHIADRVETFLFW